MLLGLGECHQELPTEPYQSVSNAMEITVGTNPNVSSNGLKLAFLRDGQLFICDTNGNNVTQITNGNIRVSSPQWSPDNKKIGFVQLDSSYMYKDKLMMIDVSTKIITRLSFSDSLYWSDTRNYIWKWSPDNSKIAILVYSSLKQFVKIITNNGSGETISKYPVSEFSWNADGSKIVCSNKINYDTSYVYVAPVVQDTLNKVSPRSYAYSVEWLPNANVILYRTKYEGLKYYDLDSNTEINTFSIYDDYKLSPDGKYIAYYYFYNNSNPDGDDELSIYILDTFSKVTKLLVSSNRGISFVWAPSSTEIYYTFNGKIYKKQL